jgi:hypothetical protein
MVSPSGIHLKCFPTVTASLLAVLLFWAIAAFSQVATTVEGKLINGTDPSMPAAGLELDVVSLQGGMSVLRSVVADASGEFRIQGLPRSEMLMIQVDYQGVNYHGTVDFDAAGKARVEITIYEPTTSFEGIELEGVQLAFQMMGEELNALESYSFNNKTEPPRTFVGDEGAIRFAKTSGVPGLPRLSVRAPGASFPLTQPATESSDGSSVTSSYPLRPGVTTFNLEQSLPYPERRFTYRKRFYHDTGAINIGLIPEDMEISGEGLLKLETERQDIAVYTAGKAEAGKEVLLTLSGGTRVAAENQRSSTVIAIPNAVSRNALVAGPLILMGLVLILWVGANRMLEPSPTAGGRGKAELKARRDELLTHLARLEDQFENQGLARSEYHRQRDLGKRRLRRISMLLDRK